MEKLIISLVQANQIWEDKAANYQNYNRLLGSIPSADLVVLPEMFSTGFSMNAANLAEEMESSTAIEWLKQVSLAKNTAIYTSLIIKENGHFYNRGVFVAQGEVVAHYDKRKTFGLAGEDKIYTAGNTPVIVNYKGWNIRLQICYDLRFPEIALNKITDGQPEYDLLLYVANWPKRRNVHWNTLLPARAIENQCFVAGVNRVGTDANGLTYSGDSVVYDLLGQQLCYSAHQEQVLTCELSKKELLDNREKLPFLKDRE
ncbi:MAG TPA: nitrilase-related carbon-nitrogen hydrolase [Taishania sp.]|nr:nitrilase-related carbon-nitrogen hydrolase [Taishania sp.]HNS41612.1 nitrilase-related carbon-nitrogen hydrolase [Taishania sp.]